MVVVLVNMYGTTECGVGRHREMCGYRGTRECGVA
jgi:hypothetical protein